MVENASASTKRGRPRKFDADQVIDDAMGAFFANGFDGTTLGDLEEATGTDRSTLYNHFGGKRGLYTSALERYLTTAEATLFHGLHHGTDDGLADLLAFLEMLRAGLTGGPVSPGCLVVNDMAAGSNPEAAARYRRLLDDGLRAALRRTSADADQIDRRAGVLSATVIGINLISKHTGDNAQVARLVDAAIAEVTSWR